PEPPGERESPTYITSCILLTMLISSCECKLFVQAGGVWAYVLPSADGKVRRSSAIFKEVKRMICPRCQNQVADGVKFCPTCGSPMPVGQTPPPPSPYGAPPQGQYGVPSQGQYGAPPQGPYGVPSQGAYIPPNQYEEYGNSMFGAGVPKAELHNPKGPLKVG